MRITHRRRKKQRCFLRKTLNVARQVSDIRSIRCAQRTCEKSGWRRIGRRRRRRLRHSPRPKYDKAIECLIKDRDTRLTFFNFPADYWNHLRTTNPIEGVFAVRHRSVPMKGVARHRSHHRFRAGDGRVGNLAKTARSKPVAGTGRFSKNGGRVYLRTGEGPCFCRPEIVRWRGLDKARQISGF
ncbi:MAG: transposase [Methylocella sp.]